MGTFGTAPTTSAVQLQRRSCSGVASLFTESGLRDEASNLHVCMYLVMPFHICNYDGIT